ncbi:argininosuccinate lyase [Jannaschia aquimarina]|uniref:Argininosuccinate lyase n=1 Tax=Jannaschia aquimarina TaxID=935700 RepID=A0A0D1EHR8_9RHOB|nr:argininosuccinate lyase [Jannaschia aquimarina]KIT16431.1 hypothetical protein jaqu_18180 [Jannaschia aquimarina]SNS92162.1 hypothetical protein SAMN05421775_103318 [Jannaschia aquimarina]
MIRSVLLLLMLAACGVDGDPVPPSEVEDAEQRRTGITISGTVEAGIASRF